MRIARAVAILCIITVCIVPFAYGRDAKKATSEVVATYGGVSVTAEELDRAVGNRLMRVRTDEYNIRRAALDELITERLVQAEAKRRGITVEELLRAEVDAKVVTPGPAEIEPFYEGTKERYGDLSKEDAIHKIRDGMRKQKASARLAELHQSLRDAAAVRVTLDPPRIALTLSGPTRGTAGAPVSIIEFSDYECPFCGRASATLKRIESAYGGAVEIVFRDFPLPSHRGAPRAAEAAYCAGDQGKYWEMHDRLFSKGGAIAEGDIRKFAAELQLDADIFASCLDSGLHTATWKKAQAEGLAAGVQSTPTFFINGRMIAGAAGYESFAKVIDEELARAGARRGAAGAEGRTP